MSYFKMTLAMIIFASGSIFFEGIGLPPAIVAAVRAIVGMALVAVVLGFSRSRSGFAGFKKNAFSIIFSGIALAFNWIFLFSAYQRTGSSVVAVCYGVAPVLVLITAPLFLREKVTLLNVACTLGAFAGTVLVSGIFAGKYPDLLGVMYALIAAALYCAVIILNKNIGNITCLDNAFYQFVVAAVTSVVYAIFTAKNVSFAVSSQTVWKLLIISVLHTGIAYSLMYSAMKKMSAQNWGIMSYIEPLAAAVIAYFILERNLNHIQMLGAFLILGFVLIAGFVKRRR